MILNRGNHEDFAICTVYGFQLECCEKYGDVIFGLFVEIFQQLPLFAVVNQAVIVLHGGLFHTEDTTLAELDKIDRYLPVSHHVNPSGPYNIYFLHMLGLRFRCKICPTVVTAWCPSLARRTRSS